MNTLPINLFYVYSANDDGLRNELEKHLSLLRRQNIIADWHFRKISGGKEWEGQINKYLNGAGIILLLVSPDFMYSDYCYDIEMKRAIQLHEAGTARVVPVILRPVDWSSALFGKLQALPKDGKPITKWDNRDEAFHNVSQGLRQICEEIIGATGTSILRKEERQELTEVNMYCSRCGAPASERSECTGLEMFHDFVPYSRNTYCSRCGAPVGKRSECIGLEMFHDFVSYSRNAYCSRCGAPVGKRSECTGLVMCHDFVS
jgi:hypothetical protein